jgi:hypothetical protein
MRKAFGVFLSLSLPLVLLSTPCPSNVCSVKPDDSSRLRVLGSYGKLPLSFVENKGQVDKRVSYYLRRGQGTIFFTKKAIVYDLISGESPILREAKGRTKEAARLSFTLEPIGAHEDVRLVARNRLPGKTNYFIGSDPKRWHTDIAMYREIVYRGLFEGIDLRLYGTNNQMEYDFIVHPGGDPKDITMGFEGIQGLNVDSGGNLIIKTVFGQLKHLKPVIYQEIEGTRQIVKGSFKVDKNKNSFGFDVEDYNNNYPLVIDPLTLSYSTLLGGSDEDYGLGIAVDSSGNAYVTGLTRSMDFPTQNPYQGTHGGGHVFDTLDDAFVTKLGPAGNTLSYSTYLGGSSADSAVDIAVDSSGNAYVTGFTSSTDFPTQNPYQGTYAGGYWDGFVTKLGPAGNTLSYSTYLGGSSADHAVGIAVDSSGNAYVTGDTWSTDFPTQNPYQGTHEGLDYSFDAFVTKLGPAGNTLSYSTYLGGSGDDCGRGIAVDSSGNAYVTGDTLSGDFPTENPYQGIYGCCEGGMDGFVTKLGPTGNTLSYSTFLGGNRKDTGGGIAVDSSGNAYVTGSTNSTDFPTESPYQGTYAGGSDESPGDAFVTKLGPSGTTLSYSTYLGGSSADHGVGIVVDSSGNVYVTGYSFSTDFPTENPYQETYGRAPHDAFVTKFVSQASRGSPSPPPSDDGGSGCFIATATYGSPLSNRVKVFKQVRDQYLLTNGLGKAFVCVYYKYSPPVADFIAKHPVIRKIVRIGLYPIVGLSKWLVGENPSK